MKPRVLIYRSDLLPASETFIAAQAAALGRYQPVFAGLRRCRPSLPLPSDHVILPRATLGERLLFRTTGFAAGLLQSATEQHASLLHAHFALDAAEALPLRRALGLPLVVTLHGYDVMCSDDAHRSSRRGRLYLARRDELWAQAALFICVSNAIRERALERGFPAHKLRVLPVGIDIRALAPQSALPREPVILFVGRLVRKKGCHVLLEAVARVQRMLPRARLMIVGDGPERRFLEEKAAELTTGTRFLGVRTPAQVHVLMRSARCLAAPSVTANNGDAEGMPMVLCEALALGLPVASTMHSGIPELVRHGEHGLLSGENDAEALAGNLLALLTDDALVQNLRCAGRARVEQTFDVLRQTEALEDLYDEVVAAQHESGLTRPYVSSLTTTKEQVLFKQAPLPLISHVETIANLVERRESDEEPATLSAAQSTPVSGEGGSRLRYQAAWLLSGNGAAVLFQALYFLLMGRMLGSREYGAFVGVVALVNVLAQFSSLGMEMVLLRTIARDRSAFAATWSRALVISAGGFVLLLLAVNAYGYLFLPPPLRQMLPYLALSDALFGKLTQLCSRALQGAGLARWSAKLLVLTNAARAASAALLFLYSVYAHVHVAVFTWVRLYCIASLLVAAASFVLVTRMLGRPRWAPVQREHLMEGLSFSFSSSAISVYNDIDKTMLVSYGMLHAAGIYAAAYRVVDVVSTPIVSLFAAASPQLFRQGAREGPSGAQRGAHALLRWAVPFGLVAAPTLALCAPVLPRLFGHSFAASTGALRFLCLLPLLRGLHYAWGTAITACANQWLRTGAQAGVALLNLLLNLWLIPRWGWQGAASASLLTDSALALTTFFILRILVGRNSPTIDGPGPLRRGALQCAE